MVNPYIVVLDVAADAVRALLFDSEARHMEGYAAQSPRRAEAGSDCLDEMHRLVDAAGFPIGAVVGRAESEVTAEDRSLWPAFEGAEWFPALPGCSGAMLGSGCAGRERFGLMIDGDRSMLGAVIESPVTGCIEIDEKRWLVSSAIPEAGGIYSSLKRAIQGSVEEFLDRAAADDPRLAPLDSAARQLREVYETLSRLVGAPAEVIGCGAALLKSPAFARRIAGALGAPLTLSTEPEPAGRGAALWALNRVGAIEDLNALPASTGGVFPCGAIAGRGE
jgi:hypothetical protein